MGEAPDVSEGCTVEITYAATSKLRSGRRSAEAEVTETCGEIVHLANPFGFDDPTLVLDSDGDLWARDEDGRDRLFGTMARMEV